jgi:hypothetical protein
MPDNRKTFGRMTTRGYYPDSIKSFGLSERTIRQASVDVESVTGLANSSRWTIRTILKAENPSGEVIVGAVPYQIMYFLGSLSTSNIIPHQAASVASYSNIAVGNPVTGTTTIYTERFPIHTTYAPTFQPYADDDTFYGGSNGKNLVIYNSITNLSGSSQDFFAIIQTRAFIPTAASGRRGAATT